jgi:hypothetical protein
VGLRLAALEFFQLQELDGASLKPLVGFYFSASNISSQRFFFPSSCHSHHGKLISRNPTLDKQRV